MKQSTTQKAYHSKQLFCFIFVKLEIEKDEWWKFECERNLLSSIEKTLRTHIIQCVVFVLIKKKTENLEPNMDTLL